VDEDEDGGDSTGLAREESVAPAEVDQGCDEREEQEDAEERLRDAQKDWKVSVVL